MLLSNLLRFSIDPALELLPNEMRSDVARTFLVAAALERSGAKIRYTMKPDQRSYWMIDRMHGLSGVTIDSSTRGAFCAVCNILDYSPFEHDLIFDALLDNDILAASVARLMLHRACPDTGCIDGSNKGWEIYAKIWPDNRQDQSSWGANWTNAEEAVRDVHPQSYLNPSTRIDIEHFSVS